MSGMASLKKIFPIIAVTWILSLVTTIVIVYVALTVPPMEAGQSDFLIWRKGATYYAKNSATGTIESGQNATALINNAISQLSFGGTISLRDATYDLDGTISIIDKFNINVIGESCETKLNLTENSNTDIMEIAKSRYISIENLSFEGNRDSQANGKGIVVYNSERVTIEGCFFYEIRQTAIYFYGIEPLGSLQPWICDNYIDNVGNSTADHGVWIGDYASDAHVVNNDIGRVTGSAIYCTSGGFLIETNTLWSSNYGVNVFLAGSGNLIGNIADNNTREGINMDSCSNLVVTGNTAKLNSRGSPNSFSGIYLYNSNYTTVSGNRAGAIGDYQPETQRYGIKEYGLSSDYNVITGNNALGNMDSITDIFTVGPNTLVSTNLMRNATPSS